jgi:DNA adenine methylase
MSGAVEEMAIGALAPWFGGNRIQAEMVGRELGRLAWCGVLFAGGMPEIRYITTQAGVAIDLHRHMINMARVVADPVLLCRMIRRIERLLFHPDVIAEAQRRCLDREQAGGGGGLFCGDADQKPKVSKPDVDWAADYFTACWMGRGGYAGRDGELSQSLSVRWTASGGSSAKRWRSALESLPAWGRVFLERWQFVCMDAFEMLTNLSPQERAGLYLDPPWVELGARYRHTFTEAQHVRLAKELHRLGSGDGAYRIVLRYGDHPLIRGLYPAPRWRWIESATKNQQNKEVREVLIVGGGAQS